MLENPVYAYGSVASSTGPGNIVLYPTANVGITFDGGGTFTVVTKGIYFIHAQQLVTTGASAVYFHIHINGSTLKYGYIPANHMNDVIASGMAELSVGNTIRLYREGTANGTWEGPHSSFQIYLIKRT